MKRKCESPTFSHVWVQQCYKEADNPHLNPIKMGFLVKRTNFVNDEVMNDGDNELSSFNFIIVFHSI